MTELKDTIPHKALAKLADVIKEHKQIRRLSSEELANQLIEYVLTDLLLLSRESHLVREAVERLRAEGMRTMRLRLSPHSDLETLIKEHKDFRRYGHDKLFLNIWVAKLFAGGTTTPEQVSELVWVAYMFGFKEAESGHVLST